MELQILLTLGICFPLENSLVFLINKTMQLKAYLIAVGQSSAQYNVLNGWIIERNASHGKNNWTKGCL